MENIGELYDIRFPQKERDAKDKLWKVLCESYFQQFVAADGALLEIACGFGEFSKNIRAKRKVAVDVNPKVASLLPANIEFHLCEADAIRAVPNSSIDTCFVSNFFEHLESKKAMDLVLQEILRVLKPNGRFIIMQPNIKYSSREYWDFYDHHLPLSHLSAAEGLAKNGFMIDKVVPKFVPFSTKSRYPQHPILVRLYLSFPFLWKLLGKQFVIIARKPIGQ